MNFAPAGWRVIVFLWIGFLLTSDTKCRSQLPRGFALAHGHRSGGWHFLLVRHSLLVRILCWSMDDVSSSSRHSLLVCILCWSMDDVF